MKGFNYLQKSYTLHAQDYEYRSSKKDNSPNRIFSSSLGRFCPVSTTARSRWQDMIWKKSWRGRVSNSTQHKQMRDYFIKSNDFLCVAYLMVANSVQLGISVHFLGLTQALVLVTFLFLWIVPLQWSHNPTT